jgi:hypothetical protein
VTGLAGVAAVVLAEVVAGGLAFTWLTPLWNETKRSYFTIYGAILGLVFALPGWLSARSGAEPGSAAGAWASRLTLITLIAVVVWTGLLLFRAESAGRVAGVISVPLSLAALVAIAGAGRASYAVALFQLLAGAAFLGATYDGLLLGHWYLTDRSLSRTPINRYTTIMLASVAIAAVAVVTGGFAGTTSTSSILNPLLTTGALAPWIALGMVAATGLVAALTKAALRGPRASAVQAATGFFYLAVVTAFTAQVAVTTRFLE